MILNIEKFSEDLKERNIAPKNIQFSKWQNWTLVSCFSEIDSSQFISEEVTMGIDRDPNIALMKGLTEYCERKAMHETSDPSARLMARSDGFAALPRSYNFSKKKVEENALNEAIERYLWANWWDTLSTSYFINDDSEFPEKKMIMAEFNLEKISAIHVLPSNHDTGLLILIAKIMNGGYVTGGAAANLTKKNEAFSRAFGELLRHLIVVKKMMESKPQRLSFYEKRLHGFGSGMWNHIVEQRLNQVGDAKITLPELIVNKEILHSNSDFIILHRCLFKNQPIFMGGNLERLCI